MSRRLAVPLAVVVAVAVGLLVQSAAAQETVSFARVVEYGSSPMDTSWADSNRIIVLLHPLDGVTSWPINHGSLSGRSWQNWQAVVINPGPGGAVLLIINVEVDASSGQRIVNIGADTRVGCTKYLDTDEDGNRTLREVVPCGTPDARWSSRKMTGQLAVRGNSQAFLFSAVTDTLIGGDDMAIVTGQQDEFGFADVVITRQGEKPIRTTLLSDFPLEPGDKIADILPLDYDALTGETLYGAFVEY